MTSHFDSESLESTAGMLLGLIGVCLIMIPVGIVTLAYVLERQVTRRLHVKGPTERLIDHFSKAMDDKP
jgi:hypothetical protein